MAKYLYGAAVQGIQGFILETNKLREIAGGSEFVEEICTSCFEEELDIKKGEEHPGKIIGAAGNIRYVLDEATCKKAIRNFPKSIIEQAPGISIVQAAVKLSGDFPEKEDFSTLEKKLEAQRNQPAPSFLPSWMAVERSRRTGLGAQEKGKDRKGNVIYPSRQEALKRDVSEKGKGKRLLQAITGNKDINWKLFPLEIDQIAEKNGSERDQWIAVMHADGNGLGQLILKLMNEKSGAELFNIYREFSQQLDVATKAAAAAAFESVFPELDKFSEKVKVPIRPILLGGDDITIIIKADKALRFTKVFMEQFEVQTKEHFKNIPWPELKDGLTIKAGIAYVKPSYPFHYAVGLAGALCDRAKAEAKKVRKDGPIPSCLMFHQVHSSFIGSYKEMIERELTANKTHRFDFGPYFLEPKNGYASIAELESWMAIFKQEDAPAPQVRSLVTEYADGKVERAQQREERIRSLKSYEDKLQEAGMGGSSIFRDRDGQKVSPALDIINMAKLHIKPAKQEA